MEKTKSTQINTWVLISFEIVAVLTMVILFTKFITSKTIGTISADTTCLISECAYTEMKLSDEYFEFTDRLGTEHKIKKVDINALAFQNSPDRTVRIYEVDTNSYNIVVTKEDKTDTEKEPS